MASCDSNGCECPYSKYDNIPVKYYAILKPINFDCPYINELQIVHDYTKEILKFLPVIDVAKLCSSYLFSRVKFCFHGMSQLLTLQDPDAYNLHPQHCFTGDRINNNGYNRRQSECKVTACTDYILDGNGKKIFINKLTNSDNVASDGVTFNGCGNKKNFNNIGFFWKGEYAHGLIGYNGDLKVWPTAKAGKYLGESRPLRAARITRPGLDDQLSQQAKLSIDSAFAPLVYINGVDGDDDELSIEFKMDDYQYNFNFFKDAVLSFKKVLDLPSKVLNRVTKGSSICSFSIKGHYTALYEIYQDHLQPLTDELNYVLQNYVKFSERYKEHYHPFIW